MAKVQKMKNLVQIVTKKKQQMKLVLVRLIILIPEKNQRLSSSLESVSITISGTPRENEIPLS
jgi:hypothetical protein